jgi:hypothetical protein
VTRLAFELDDRTLAVARDGVVVATAPAVAFDGRGGEPPGAHAWHAQRRTPTHVSSRHLSEVALDASPAERTLALTAAQLAKHLEPHRDRDATLWIAAPAVFGASGLSAVLAIVRQLELRPAGFIDAGAAIAAALAPLRTTLVLELGLHHIAVIAVETGAQARRRRALVSVRGGLIELYEAWLDLIRAAMVKKTRFDPLHDAATDQQVFDSLPQLAREAATNGSATATIVAGEERFEVALSRDQFEGAGEPVYREIVRVLRELRHAGAAVTIVAPKLILDLPGLRGALDTFRNCELIVIDDGFAAAAATVLDLPAANDAEPDAVRLIRRVPAARAPALERFASGFALGSDSAQDPTPSHVLYEGHAFALDRGPLIVGRGGEGEAAIALPEGLAGVSRRHCTFLHDGEHLVLVDHSAFGTFVNGERVSERVRILAGDRVRVGEPGVELSLIAVGA